MAGGSLEGTIEAQRCYGDVARKQCGQTAQGNVVDRRGGSGTTLGNDPTEDRRSEGGWEGKGNQNEGVKGKGGGIPGGSAGRSGGEVTGEELNRGTKRRIDGDGDGFLRMDISSINGVDNQGETTPLRKPPHLPPVSLDDDGYEDYDSAVGGGAGTSGEPREDDGTGAREDDAASISQVSILSSQRGVQPGFGAAPKTRRNYKGPYDNGAASSGAATPGRTHVGGGGGGRNWADIFEAKEAEDKQEWRESHKRTIRQ